MEAHMQAHFATQANQLRDTIVCPKCGNCGVITWDYVSTAHGLRKELGAIAGDFYEHLNAKVPHPIELICTTCHTVLRQERDSEVI
jgi:hypothetical protein